MNNKSFPFTIPEESVRSNQKKEVHSGSGRLLVKKILGIILLVTIIAFFVSCFLKYKLPSRGVIDNYLYKEPEQKETNILPFEVNKENITYKIIPKYSYDIYGLIVSDYNSENWFDVAHKKDPLNTKDICVIWGNNIKNDVYQKLKFSHGEFTCYVKAKLGADPSMVYPLFSWEKGSNNHLLPKDNVVYSRIKEAKIGDQIHLKGYLVSYSVSENGTLIGTRGTSTIRTDNGNGACETIYVEDFQILKKANQFWRFIYSYSGYLIFLCLIALLII
jgi:hypothetical protein